MHLLIYNPKSGNSGDETCYLTSKLSEYNTPYKLIYTEQDNIDHLKQYLKKAKTVIIAGGDGTVSLVINEITELEERPVVIIYPRGTTNEYAKSIGVTKDTFLKYLENQYLIKKIDIGQYNEESIFTYSMAFGNFSHIPYETPQWLKNRIGYIAYWLYAFLTLYVLKMKKYQMSFKYNDSVVEGKYMFGAISNSDTLGRLLRLNDVIYDDGLLELVLVKAPNSFKEIIYFLGDVRSGTNKSGIIIHDKIKEISVSSLKKHSWSADGEFSGKYDQLDIKVLKKYLKVIYSK